MSIVVHTYKQPLHLTGKLNNIIFEMAKESGNVYSTAMRLNKIEHKSIPEINKEMGKYCKRNRKYLLAQSSQASYQNYIINLKSYFKALKKYKKNPSGFSGKPKPPRRNKFLYKITFKKEAVRYKDNNLLLSVNKPYDPIKIKWSEKLPIPKWVIINFDRYEGWNINFVMDKEIKKIELDSNKIMSVDLGVKRVAATFDGQNTTLYNGKPLMSLNRLDNKVEGKIKSRQSKLRKNSRKYKKLQRSKRNIKRRIKNKRKDILHKYSRHIVNNAINNKISEIIFGNNSSTHNKTDTGKENQKIQQSPEQQLRKYVEYKFQSVGGTTKVVPEKYTTRTCPKCGNVKKSSPNGRIYKCKKCNFVFDRDGVGSINIMHKNVSFDPERWSNVVGGLTPPRGIKYIPQLSFIISNNNKILDGCSGLRDKQFIECYADSNRSGTEEPHVL